MTEDADFEAWYESLEIVHGDYLDQAETERRRTFLHRWLHAFYAAHGPLTMDLVGIALVLDQVQLATEDVKIVLADLARTTNLQPDVVVDDYEGGVRVSFNGSYTAPSVWEWENPDALAEVADYLQEHVVEELHTAWPTCPEHGFGLHAEVHGQTAVWWCRYRNHTVARVGHLGLGG